MVFKYIAKFRLESSEGNPLRQGLSDYTTLKIRCKCTSMGLEMVGPNLKCNLGAYLCMARIKDGTFVAGHDALSKMLFDRFGYK